MIPLLFTSCTHLAEQRNFTHIYIQVLLKHCTHTHTHTTHTAHSTHAHTHAENALHTKHATRFTITTLTRDNGKFEFCV